MEGMQTWSGLSLLGKVKNRAKNWCSFKFLEKLATNWYLLRSLSCFCSRRGHRQWVHLCAIEQLLCHVLGLQWLWATRNVESQRCFGADSCRPGKWFGPGEILQSTDTGLTCAFSGALTAAIACGTAHVCALQQGGSIVCWGFNDDNQIEAGNTSEIFGPTAVKLDTGWYQICKNTRIPLFARLMPWISEHCQVESFVSVNQRLPSHFWWVVTTDSVATAVAAGGNHSCALMQNGQILCWGTNSNGQLGSGSTAGSRSTVLLGERIVCAVLGRVNHYAPTNVHTPKVAAHSQCFLRMDAGE